MSRTAIVVLGAGPAGLGAALQLARRDCFAVTVIEKNGAVAGNAGSFEIAGLRVDYGSHRLHRSCRPEILADIRSMLGADLLERPRHGRILLRGRWIHFPLQPLDLALHLPPSFLLSALRDTFGLRSRSDGPATFASVLERGLGPTICRDFYFPYAWKIWGVPPDQLDAEQAHRRVSASSASKMLAKVIHGLPGLRGNGRSSSFYYPRHGYGQISEAYCDAALQAGASIRLQTHLEQIDLDSGRMISVSIRSEKGQQRLDAGQVLSTIPLPALARAVSPAAPPAVLESASALQYRAMVLVYLVLATDRFTEYDAHYFPGPEVPVTRLSEPKNYSLAELPGRTVLCAELPCSVRDRVWTAADEELGILVLQALAAAQLPVGVPVQSVATRRLEHAYPIYSLDFREHFRRLDAWASATDGLLTLGRQGLFAHDNTHHALAMAYAASECLDDNGDLDRQRWAQYRRQFEEHVVED